MIVLSATFCFAAVGRNLWAWFGPPSWVPRITCKETMFDFGERALGDAIDYEFVLTNTGRENLRIKEITGDCSCLAVNVPEADVPPGNVLKVPVRILLQDRKPGPLQQRVLVQSNDPINRSLLLTVKGSVRKSAKTPSTSVPVPATARDGTASEGSSE
jgi:hypothetical protein